MSSLPPIPAGFKKYAGMLRTADSLQKAAPLVAYHCRMFVVNDGMTIARQDKDCKSFLLALMDRLEQEKAHLQHEAGLKDSFVALQTMEATGLALFARADREDRAGNANKATADAFYKASLIFDAMAQFEGGDQACAEQRKYAKLKALDIKRCLKDGRKPAPGPIDQDGNPIQVEQAQEPGEEGGDAELFSMPPLPEPPAEGETRASPRPPPSHSPRPASDAGSNAPFSYTAGTGSTSSAGRSNSDGAARSSAPTVQVPVPSGHVRRNLSVEEESEVKKYCKYTMSAMDYSDYNTAAENLRKALSLLLQS